MFDPDDLLFPRGLPEFQWINFYRKAVLLLVLVMTTILAGCGPRSAPASADTSAMRERRMQISEQFQKDWERCVNASYKVAQQQMADKNAAAEWAFASCATEEDQMNSVYDPGINAMVMPHFKAEAKRLLIEQGQIPGA